MPARHDWQPQLPPQPTTFLGRDEEIASVSELLANPACRLLTIIGPGGVGKTRLAIEVATRQRERHGEEVAFVALLGVGHAGEVPAAIGSAIGVPLSGPDETRHQLLNALSHRRLLLVLDNAEHLADNALIFSELLAGAPRIRLLVTSRIALQLQEEWRFPLTGLPVGNGTTVDQPQDDVAMRLFAERAGRVRPDFSLAAERGAVVRICRLVEGLPLAIELAAGWVATLTCDAIANEIERDVSLLETNLRNVPERHRSIRAVFDHSWRLMTDEERLVFSRLAVFRGGFRQEAAMPVAQATLPVLASLVTKSLIRYESDGRYHLHELLRQYASEQLQSAPEERDRVQERHRAYYMKFLAEQGVQLASGAQRAALIAIAGELSNVRVAWQRALDQLNVDEIQPAIEAMAGFYHLRGRYREGLDTLKPATSRLRDAPQTRVADRALASALHETGQLHTRLGEFGDARAALEEARARYTNLNEPLPPGLATDPDIGLGVLALIAGEFESAARFGEGVRNRAEIQKHSGNLPYGWYLTTQAAMAQGHVDAARRAAWSAYTAARQSRDDWFLAYCLNDLGTIAVMSGSYAEAREHFRESFDVREQLDDHEGKAVALVHLGKVALLEGDLSEARAYFERAFSIYQDIGDRGGLAAALHGLGLTAAGGNDRMSAARHLERALQIAGEIGLVSRALAIAIDLADFLLQGGGSEGAIEVASLVLRHVAADRETRKHAQRLIAGRQPMSGVEGFAPSEQPNLASDLDRITVLLQTELTVQRGQPGAGHSPLTASPRTDQASIDPLSERELAVLRLIAAGRSNREIADELFLAVSTVKWYSGLVYDKLGVRNRTEAAARAREIGLLA